MDSIRYENKDLEVYNVDEVSQKTDNMIGTSLPYAQANAGRLARGKVYGGVNRAQEFGNIIATYFKY